MNSLTFCTNYSYIFHFEVSRKLYLHLFQCFNIVVEVSGHEDPLIVGLSRRITCTTYLNVTRMEWVLVGVPDPVEERNDGGQELDLPLNPNNTDLDGAMFTCRITTARENFFEETITIEVKGYSYIKYLLRDKVV